MNALPDEMVILLLITNLLMPLCFCKLYTYQHMHFFIIDFCIFDEGYLHSALDLILPWNATLPLVDFLQESQSLQ